jgi:hypothetical protein
MVILLIREISHIGGMMTVTDLVHDFVLTLLRRGFSVAQVAQALADQKVKLMQVDEYMAATQESNKAP